MRHIVLLYLLIASLLTASGENISINLKDYASIDIKQFFIETQNPIDENFTYKIEINNSGEILLRNVTAIDTLPIYVNYVDSRYATLLDQLRVTRLNDTKEGAEKIIWHLGDLNPGEERRIRLSARANQKSGDFLTNDVTVEGWALGNRIEFQSSQATKIQAATEGIVSAGQTFQTKNDTLGHLDLNNISLGPRIEVNSYYERSTTKRNVINYTFDVRNIGDKELDKIVLNDTLPRGMKYINASLKPINISQTTNNINISWNLGKLLAIAGDKGVRSINISVDDSSVEEIPENNTIYVTFKAEGRDFTYGPTKSNKYPVHKLF